VGTSAFFTLRIGVTVIVPFLTTAIGLTFGSIAVGSFAATKPFAETYGLPVENDHDIVLYRAVGARDLILGAITIAAERSGSTNTQIAGTVFLSALAGLADFSLIAAAPDSKKSRLLIHGGGTLGLMIAAAIIAATPENSQEQSSGEG